MGKGVLITLSGIDCCGKSTQISILYKKLREERNNVKIFWYRPGYSTELDWLRRIIRTVRPSALPASDKKMERERIFKKKRTQILWMIVSIVDMLLQYNVKIRWLRFSGSVIICDRYILDALLDLKLRFEGFEKLISYLNRYLPMMVPKPDYSFLITIPYKVMLQRMITKNEPFPDPPEIREKRYANYVSFARNQLMIEIDGAHDKDEIHSSIVGHINI